MAANTAELIDTGEKRDRRGRKLVPVEQRMELAAQWRKSGLTQAEFARREGVRYTTFVGWVQKQKNQSRTPPMRFLEVQSPVAARGHALEVSLPDGTQLRGTNAEELAKLVRVLRS